MVFLEKNRVHNYNRVYMCVQKAFAQGRHVGHLRLPGTALRNPTIQKVSRWLLYSSVYQSSELEVYSHTVELNDQRWY
jgi:hypothetical protein